MMYKAKDGHFYRIREAKQEDFLNIIRVHGISARKTYEPFKEQYSKLYEAFSISNLTASWNEYFKKCKENPNFIGIVAEKLYGTHEGVKSTIVGISKAGTLSAQYRHHLEEVSGKSITKEESDKYANLQTIYIDPQYQGLGLGKAIMGYFARHFSKKGCEYAITETLSGYENSPKFFNKIGGAKCLGDYNEDPMTAVANSVSDGKDNIPLKLWLMPDINQMKIPCHLAEQRKIFMSLKNDNVVYRSVAFRN